MGIPAPSETSLLHFTAEEEEAKTQCIATYRLYCETPKQRGAVSDADISTEFLPVF